MWYEKLGIPHSATILARSRHLMMAVYGRNMLWEGKGTILSCIVDRNILYEINSKQQSKEHCTLNKKPWAYAPGNLFCEQRDLWCCYYSDIHFYGWLPFTLTCSQPHSNFPLRETQQLNQFTVILIPARINHWGVSCMCPQSQNRLNMSTRLQNLR
jgi:hypothetical protein